jgi:predicted phage-related endonuclease
MAATLDGRVASTGAVFEAKFALPRTFSEEAAADKHMAQLQHNMWVTASRMAALSIITGGGKWVEMTISADPLYQHLLLTAEKKFWRCVETGETPHLFAKATDRGGPGGRYEFVQRLGGICRKFPADPIGFPRTRKDQG